jgi:hypothetical protein
MAPQTRFQWYAPLPDYAPERAVYERLSAMCHTPPWSHALVSTFFDNRPCAETQASYRAAGRKAPAYWVGELSLLFRSTLTVTDEFLAVPYLEWYASRYRRAPGDRLPLSELSWEDKHHIFVSFAAQLGIHTSIFPVTLADVCER